MSVSTIITLGYGSFGAPKFIITLGYSPNTAPTPVITTAITGAGDSERDRRDFLNEMSIRLLLMDD